MATKLLKALMQKAVESLLLVYGVLSFRYMAIRMQDGIWGAIKRMLKIPNPVSKASVMDRAKKTMVRKARACIPRLKGRQMQNFVALEVS